MSGSTLSYHNKLTFSQLFKGIFKGGTLVVGIDTCGNVCVEVIARKLRSVTVNLLVMSLRGDNFSKHIFIAVDNTDIVHHLCKSEYLFIIQVQVNILAVKLRTALVNFCGRHT